MVSEGDGARHRRHRRHLIAVRIAAFVAFPERRVSALGDRATRSGASPSPRLDTIRHRAR
jgi:hypothetical protein